MSQIEIDKEVLGVAQHYLDDGMTVTIHIAENGEPVMVSTASKFLCEVRDS